MLADPVSGAQVSQGAYGKPAADAIQMLSNVRTYRTSCASANVSTNAWTDMPGISNVFTKLGTQGESDLIIELASSCYATAVGLQVKMGVNVSGSPLGDYEMTHYFFNVANDHRTVPTGWVRVPGVPAGDVTIKARWQSVSNLAQINTDGNDYVNMKVSERPI